MRILVDKDTFNELTVKFHSKDIHRRCSFRRKCCYDLLISKNQVIRRIGGHIENVTIADSDTILVEHNGREFIGDKSKVEYTDMRGFQLPTQVAEVELTMFTYKLYKNSVLSLHFEVLGNGAVRDAWFEIEDEFVGNVMAMEDIDTLLSC